LKYNEPLVNGLSPFKRAVAGSSPAESTIHLRTRSSVGRALNSP
jgi:hypothetical protein